MYRGPTDDEDAELLRYERERRERVARRNRISWRIVAWVCAAALALLAYDSATSAVSTYRDQHGGRRGTLVVTRCDARGCVGATGVRLDTGNRVRVGERVRVAVHGGRAVPLGDSQWLYPALIALACAAGLGGLAWFALRRR